ncbi:twin-arginine translocase TatA/TatE family subunit [Flavobacteriales bacterium]|jgi:sec-independent protein translocase protein TatA|nr:twin-arginine translocase TatA/TatE family subunit [Flavobacteriales bacterium]
MGATEIVFIFLVYLLLFGAKGIPSFARTMGGAVREFRNATDQIQREILSSTDGIKEEVNKVRKAADVSDPFNSPPARPTPEEPKSSGVASEDENTDKPNS